MSELHRVEDELDAVAEDVDELLADCEHACETHAAFDAYLLEHPEGLA